MRFNDTFNPDQWLDLCIQSVRHELKLAIWWNEGDSAIIFESRQPYTLVEPTVIELDGINSASFALVNHELVVEAELALWCAGQVRTHLNVTIDVSPQNCACRVVSILNRKGNGSLFGSARRRTFGAHAQVDRFHNVNKCFIFLVFYIASPPAYRASHL